MLRTNKYWSLITIFLIAIIIIGGVVVWVRYEPDQTLEISAPSHQEIKGEVCICGAVTNPGFYFLNSDTIEALLQAAGGATTSADLSQIELYIPEVGNGEESPQKIEINRAEAWLLEALPGIGQTLAQRIIVYRQQNGPFASTNEITKVEGIGITKYEQIKHLITITSRQPLP